MSRYTPYQKELDVVSHRCVVTETGRRPVFSIGKVGIVEGAGKMHPRAMNHVASVSERNSSILNYQSITLDLTPLIRRARVLQLSS